MIEKNYHYVYKMTYSNGMMYIGVRSCDCSIEDDPYTGSGLHVPKDIRPSGVKSILSTHSTRLEAFEEEIRLHAELNVKDNPLYYNQCNSTSTKFYPSKEAHERGAAKRRGRTKEKYEYIARQVEARKKYVGENRTEAQKAQYDASRMPERLRKYRASLAITMSDPVRAEKIRRARVRGGKSGTGIPNQKKAVPGLRHGKAFAWYYVTPEGDKVEVQDSIRGFFKTNPDALPFTRDRVMAYIREGVPRKIMDLGWEFGKLSGKE